MAAVFEVVVGAASTVTAAAMIGVYVRAGEVLDLVREHNRILKGEEAVDGWDGIVPMVQRHEEQLKELWDRLGGTGPEARTDGGVEADGPSAAAWAALADHVVDALAIVAIAAMVVYADPTWEELAIVAGVALGKRWIGRPGAS